MKKYLWLILTIICLNVFAQAQIKDPNTYGLMTGQDVKNNASSNISIKNGMTKAVNVNGIFIASYDSAVGGEDCSSCFGNIVAGDNLGGSVVSPVIFQANQSLAIGENYLYNMLYNSVYYIQNTLGSSPCKLPGCSWAGDTPNLKWCITINAVSLDSNYTYNPDYKKSPAYPAAAVPAYGAAGNSINYGYSYDLIDPNTLGTGNACLGPITCDDKTLTCKVERPQSETFQKYSAKGIHQGQVSA